MQWKIASLELFCTIFNIPVDRQVRADSVILKVAATEGALNTKGAYL